jgi:hypothetical protein
MAMRRLFIFLAVLAALLAVFPARARVSVAGPAGIFFLALEPCHAAVVWVKFPATWAYDVDIPIVTTGHEIAPIVTIQARYGYDAAPVSSLREDCSPRGPPPEFWRFLASKEGEYLTFYHGIELDTPTNARAMPRETRRSNGFSPTNASQAKQSSATIKLNRQAACPPPTAVPVDPSAI